MIFNFKTDKQYLLAHTLKQNVEPFPEWVTFKNYLWDISPEGYNFIIGATENFLLKNNELKKIINIALSLFKKAYCRKEFKKIYQETENYKKWLIGEWQKNEEYILKYFKEIIGIKIPTKKITIYITHPKFYNGKSFINKNTICWGHPEEWPNYSLVYLAHELLHIITKNKNSEILHALIELATDDELRLRLNKKGSYFKKGKNKIGHPYLLTTKRKILPYWKKYLKNKNHKNIITLEEEIKRLV